MDSAEIVRLRQFLRVSLVTSVVCFPLVLSLEALVTRTGWLYWLVLVVGANVVRCEAELRLLDAGRVRSAVLLYAAADWAIALLVVAIVPVMLPVSASVVALPLVTAMPFLGRRGVEALAAAGAVVMVAVGLLGTMQNATGVTQLLPRWIQIGLLLVLLPLIWTYTALNASSTSARMVDALREVRAANVDLRSSRERLVSATDTERRRIERNLHDGAQQHLLALRMSLAAARAADPRPALLDRMDAQVLAAIESLRVLARGLYPPVLTERGLAEAVREMARAATVPVSVQVDPGIGRYDPAVEAAVYFCCAEAVQNAVRHAGPDVQVTLRLWPDAGVRFEVADTGVGLPDGPDAEPVAGTGIANLRDRVGALGGTIAVESVAGQGVIVRGWVPLPAQVGQDGEHPAAGRGIVVQPELGEDRVDVLLHRSLGDH